MPLTAWSESSPHEVEYTVTVKVHIRLDFEFNWSNMLPWPGVVPHIPLIHPHTFLTASYTPYHSQTFQHKISIVHYNADCLDRLKTLECRSTQNLPDTRKWYVVANLTPQPPVIHLGNAHLKHGKFISMIVTPPDKTTTSTMITPPTMTTPPTLPSTLSDKEFNPVHYG